MPVQQTIFAGPEGDGDGQRGNCYAAALASIIERPLSFVPNFAQHDERHRWWWESRHWLRRVCDLDIVSTDKDGLLGCSPPYAIGYGPSPRGPWGHAVVVDGQGNLVHDPHPSGDGVLSLDGFDVLIDAPYDPSPDAQEYRTLACTVH